MSPATPLGEPATARAIDLLKNPVASRVTTGGFIDTLPPESAPPRTLARQLMHAAAFPLVYEAAWRPVLFTAFTGRTTGQEERIVLDGLRPAAGEIALDVACGPGNTTRRLASAVGPGGLVVGLDFAPGMLTRAVSDTSAGQVAFMRGDAEHLPLLDDTVDLVTCFGALYMIGDPWGAMAEMVRVLRPGGRLALLTTCGRGPGVARAVQRASQRVGGIAMFEPDAVLAHLRDLGVIRMEQHVRAFSQLIIGELPRD